MKNDYAFGNPRSARGLRCAFRAAVVLAFTGLCTAPASASGTVLYVRASATGANNGSSWTDAYTKLQDALGAASSGTEIWMAEGVYYPDEGVGHTDNSPSERFNMKSGVALYGGFSGKESSLGQRDWHAHKSILSGDIAQDDVDTDGNHIDETWADIVGTNTDSVVLAEGLSSNARLDGFTVTGGSSAQYGGGIYDDNSAGNQFFNLEVRGNYAYYYGGGMFVNHVDSHIEEVLFEGNSTYPDSSFCYGGGLMGNCADAATLTNVTFRNNRANMGGGIGIWPGGITVNGARFEGNTAVNYGGGVTIWDGTTSTFHNVTFSQNVGEVGAGCYFFRGGTVNMTDATFAGNYVSYTTGVSHSGGGIKTDSVSLNLTDATFAGNIAESGAGLTIESATANITNADFRGNYAVYGGGAVYGDYGAHSTFTNCSFNGNRANGNAGGAIFSCSVDPGSPNSLTLANSILWGDSASSDDSTRELLTYIYYYPGFECTSTVSVTYCDVWLPGGVYSGTGNINADPQYVSPVTAPAPTTTGDLHLQAASPAIDAGNSGVVTQLLDRGYEPRRMDDPGVPDTGTGTPPAVDLGAYEHPGNPPAIGDLMLSKADSDGDGVDDVRLEWGTVSGAVRYLVLRSDSPDKGFSQISEVTGTEAVDANALADPESSFYRVDPLGY